MNRLGNSGQLSIQTQAQFPNTSTPINKILQHYRYVCRTTRILSGWGGHFSLLCTPLSPLKWCHHFPKLSAPKVVSPHVFRHCITPSTGVVKLQGTPWIVFTVGEWERLGQDVTSLKGSIKEMINELKPIALQKISRPIQDCFITHPCKVVENASGTSDGNLNLG